MNSTIICLSELPVGLTTLDKYVRTSLGRSWEYLSWNVCAQMEHTSGPQCCLCNVFMCVCVWQISCGGPIPTSERSRDRATGRRRCVCPQEEGGRLVQRHPAEDRRDRPVSQQLRRELLSWKKRLKEHTILCSRVTKHTHDYIQTQRMDWHWFPLTAITDEKVCFEHLMNLFFVLNSLLTYNNAVLHLKINTLSLFYSIVARNIINTRHPQKPLSVQTSVHMHTHRAKPQLPLATQEAGQRFPSLVYRDSVGVSWTLWCKLLKPHRLKEHRKTSPASQFSSSASSTSKHLHKKLCSPLRPQNFNLGAFFELLWV